MADTNFRGPVTSMGSLEGQAGNTATIEPLDGPVITYQGGAVADPRFFPFAKDGFAPGRVRAYYASEDFVCVDTIPSATSTTTVAAAQTPSTTAAVALTLTTAVLGTAANVPVWAPGIPIIPTNTTVPVTVSAVDFGFATGTTAANSSTVVVTDNTLFTLNQWIVVGGAGSGSATNVALNTQVRSLAANGTSITVSPVAATALSHAPIGQGNLYNTDLPPATQFGPAAASANATEPYRLAGLAVLFDPRQGIARNLTITAASIGSGTTAILASGYDIYGVPMTEVITADGTTTVGGVKAFKYVSSVVVQTAATSGTPADISIGVGDVAGLALREDTWDYTDIRFNGGRQVASTGFTAAVLTAATNTSGDVRGRQNFSTGVFGNATATAAAGGGFNGVRRAFISLKVPQIRMIGSNPNAYTGMFGVTQA